MATMTKVVMVKQKYNARSAAVLCQRELGNSLRYDTSIIEEWKFEESPDRDESKKKN